MKTYIVIAFILSYQLVGAQTDQTINAKSYETGSNEIGINVTDFVKSFLSLNANEQEIDPLHFSFKRIRSNKGIRLQIGINSSIKRETVGNVEEKKTLSLIDLKFGYEWRKPIHKNFFVFYGADLFADYDYQKIETVSFETVTSTDNNIAFGPSLFIGFAFKINDRIFLSTESSLDILYGILNSEIFFNDTGVSFENTDYEFSAISNIPTSLYFNIKF